MPLFLHILEFALTAWLVLGLPGLALWKQLRKPRRPERSRRAAHVFNVVMIAIMLAITALLAWGLHGLPADLGFDLPLARGGKIGLAIAVALILVALIVDAVWKHRHPEAEQRAIERLDAMLPRTVADLRWFAAFILAAGTGWEILYRGFLLWVLTPLVGVVGAVCVAAIAYGFAHGFKSRKRVLGSLVSSFAFTIAFALTHSLWWLMLLHVYVGVPMLLLGRRVLRGQAPNRPVAAGETTP